MKSKDIKADGVTVYAYSEEWQWNSRYSSRSAKPVVVTGTGVARRLRGYSYGHRATDGVEVTFVDEETLKPGDLTKVVRSAEIRELWSDFVEWRDRAEKAREERKQVSLARYNALFDRIDAVLPANVTRPYGTYRQIHDDGSYAQQVRLTLDEFATLLEAAYAKGERRRF